MQSAVPAQALQYARPALQPMLFQIAVSASAAADITERTPLPVHHPAGPAIMNALLVHKRVSAVRALPPIAQLLGPQAAPAIQATTEVIL